MASSFGEHDENNYINGFYRPPPPHVILMNNLNNNHYKNSCMMIEEHDDDLSNMIIMNSNNNNNNNNMIRSSCITTNNSTGYYFMNDQQSNNDNSSNYHNAAAADGSSSSSLELLLQLKANITSHPYYNRLVSSYLNCHKIGAPPEVVKKLEEACASAVTIARQANRRSSSAVVGEDPELDQFMEAYCEMLTKYEQELSKPFNDAVLFLSTIESQFQALVNLPPAASSHSVSGQGMEFRNGTTSLEEFDNANNISFIDPQAKDLELKGQLLRKYSGYLGNLKQEFTKKSKKGKLPREARQQLLDWWSMHYKWPYPSESEKLALGETTGLDQKQINNWFINQRKRHWKPSEDMHLKFMVMDGTTRHHDHQHDYYMNNVLSSPFTMDFSQPLL